jgi:hypothetical protein
MLTYQVEAWGDFCKEAEPLWLTHWAEIAQDQTIPLVPDYATYAALDAAGMLHVVTGRDAAGTLQAYAVYLVRPHLHYATTLHGLCDVYWLHPAHRRGLEGYRLFQHVEATLRQRGVKKVITACKTYFDVSPLFTRLGYRETERVWTKVLEE